MVSTFCIYTSTAVLICFVIQLFTFCSLLVLNGHRQLSRGTNKFCGVNLPDNLKVKCVGKMGDLHARFIHFYANLVTKFWFKSAVLLVMVLYWTVASWGYRRFRVELGIHNFALPGSHIAKSETRMAKAIESMQSLMVLVERVPDLRSPGQLARVRGLVRQFETSTHGYGPEATRFWMRDYTQLLRFIDDANEEFSYTSVPAFLELGSYAHWSMHMHVNSSACRLNLPQCIEQFLFVIGFHDVVKFNDLIEPVKEWRQIAREYSDLEVCSFTDRILYADQADSLPAVIYKSAIISLICMALICVIFIPNFGSIILAVLSILSINFGVFGYLALWGIMINPLSMAALLMSIGFSVDFTAHISYQCYAHDSDNPVQRLKQALNAVGWPLVQSGLTTLLAVWPLTLNGTYLGEIFAKTVILIVLSGLFHGLVCLPTALTWLAFNSRRAKVDFVR